MKGTSLRVWPCAVIVCLLSSSALGAGVVLNTLSEDFESTLPVYLENDSASKAAWYLDSSESQSGSKSLRSGDIGNDQISAIKLNGPFSAGTLSFDYLEKTQSCCDVMEVHVDGKRFNFRTVNQSDEWQHIEMIIPADAGAVTFLYRKDEAGSARDDAVWIDNLGFSTTIDTGGEPLDTDGDGLTDDQENGYDALDPYNADDAAEDYDGDRVTNYSEVRSGYNPDVQDVFPLHDAFAFFPLGDMTRTYTLPDDSTTTIETMPEEERGRFKLANGDAYDLVERNTDGIYLVEHGFIEGDNSVRIVFMPPRLILPDQLRMGIQYEWSGTVERWVKADKDDDEADYEKVAAYDEHLELEASLEVPVDFQGKSHAGVVVSSLTTRTNEASEIRQQQLIKLFAKNLGLYYDYDTGEELESINIRNLNTESMADVEPEDTLPESSGSGGSGSMPGLLLAALALVTLSRRST